MNYKGNITITDGVATDTANRILTTLRTSDPELFADPKCPAQLAAAFACLMGFMLAQCGQATVSQMASFYQLVDLAWLKMGANGKTEGETP